MCFVLLDSSRVVLVTRFGFNVDIASELYSVNTLGGLHSLAVRLHHIDVEWVSLVKRNTRQR